MIEKIKASTPKGSSSLSLGILYNAIDDSIFLKSVGEKSIFRYTKLAPGQEILRINVMTDGAATKSQRLFSQYKKRGGDNGSAFKSFVQTLKSADCRFCGFTIEVFVKILSAIDVDDEITFKYMTEAQKGWCEGEMIYNENRVPLLFQAANVPFDIFQNIYMMVECVLLPTAIKCENQETSLDKALRGLEAKFSPVILGDRYLNLEISNQATKTANSNSLQRLHRQTDLVAYQVKDTANVILSKYNIIATLSFDEVNESLMLVNAKHEIKPKAGKRMRVVGLQFFSTNTDTDTVQQKTSSIPIAVAVAK